MTQGTERRGVPRDELPIAAQSSSRYSAEHWSVHVSKKTEAGGEKHPK